MHRLTQQLLLIEIQTQTVPVHSRRPYKTAYQGIHDGQSAVRIREKKKKKIITLITGIFTLVNFNKFEEREGFAATAIS